MIRRSLIGFATAAVLFGAACGDSDALGNEGDQDQGNASVPDAGDVTDPGADGADGSDGSDGSADPGDGASDSDAGMDDLDAGASLDAGAVKDAGTLDAGPALDAGAEIDAGASADVDGGSDDAGLPALAAQYSFDENTGAASTDSAGNFPDAVLLGDASWTSGVQGSSLELAGGASQNHAALPPNLFEGCDDVTLALWMKLGSTPFWSRLLDLDGVVDGFLFFTPAQDLGGVPHLFFNIYHPPGAGAPDQGVSAAYPAGTTLVEQWHHVAFTLSQGTGRLYFDGVEIGSNPMTTKPSDLTIGEAAHAWIGRSTFPDPYLDAAIDDLRVSCTAYSAAQVAALAR